MLQGSDPHTEATLFYHRVSADAPRLVALGNQRRNRDLIMPSVAGYLCLQLPQPGAVEQGGEIRSRRLVEGVRLLAQIEAVEHVEVFDHGLRQPPGQRGRDEIAHQYLLATAEPRARGSAVAVGSVGRPRPVYWTISSSRSSEEGQVAPQRGQVYQSRLIMLGRSSPLAVTSTWRASGRWPEAPGRQLQTGQFLRS